MLMDVNKADHIRRNLENARRSLYFSSAQLRCILNTYLDLIASHRRDYVDRVRSKINKSFDAEVRALASVRDAIVFSSLERAAASQITPYIGQFVDEIAQEEDDEDFRELRLGLFRSATVH